MITLPEVTMSYLIVLLMVLGRVTGFIFFAPVLGNRVVPMQVKVLLSFAVSMLLAGHVQYKVGAEEWPITLGMEIAVGATIGLCTNLLFMAMSMAGNLIATELGLSMSSVLDISEGGNSVVVSELLVLIGTVFFLALNGHAFVFLGLSKSFSAIQPMNFFQSEAFLKFLMVFIREIFSLSIQLAIPLIAMSFFMNLSLGLISRSIPQINIFAMSMITNILVGIILLSVMNTEITSATSRSIEEMSGILGRLFEVR